MINNLDAKLICIYGIIITVRRYEVQMLVDCIACILN